VIPDAEAEHRPGDGVEVVVAVSAETVGSPGLWFGRFTTEPGVKIPPHYHTCDTAAYLVRGRCAFDIDGGRLEMAPGDFLYVPKGAVHTEETVGNETAELIFARDDNGGETVYLDPES
jgi:uncharacterized RmlC-like cupin family protein